MQIGQKNNVVVAGFVPKDATFSLVGAKETPLAKFSVKVSGDEEDAKWANVVAWRDLAYVAQGIVKGDSVMVAGYLKKREYNEKEYVDLVAEFISVTRNNAAPAPPPVKPDDSTVPPMQDIDEDLPF
jgi:hypothetical protein